MAHVYTCACGNCNTTLTIEEGVATIESGKKASYFRVCAPLNVPERMEWDWESNLLTAHEGRSDLVIFLKGDELTEVVKLIREARRA